MVVHFTGCEFYSGIGYFYLFKIGYQNIGSGMIKYFSFKYIAIINLIEP